MPDGERKTSGFTLGYRRSLDGLRGIFVIIVMATHSFIDGMAPAGTLAMQSFFMLSGFLITVLLVREWERYGRIDLKNFYVRRALRLLPALVLFLGVTTVVIALTLPEILRTAHTRGAFATLFYFFNWAYIYNWMEQVTVLGHTWSLSVEEQFYMVWPILLILLLRLRVSRAAKIGLVAAAVVAFVAERALLLRTPQPTFRSLIGTDMHADSLLVGCALGLAACWGLLPERRLLLRVTKVLAFASIVFLVWHSVPPLRWDKPWLDAFELAGGQGVRVVALGFMFLTLLVSPPRLALLLLEAPVIVWLGRRSYPIYLWHLGINAYLVIRLAWLGEATIAVIGAILSLSIAAVSFRWVESPFLRLKTRFTAEPSSNMTVRAQTGADAAPLAAKVDA